MSEETKTTALADEEVAEATGGSGGDKCPKGHYEATGFANFFLPTAIAT